MSREQYTADDADTAAKLTFKIVVTNTSNCKSILLYIRAHINAINNMGVYILPILITEADRDAATIQKMYRAGITSTPTLVAPDGKLFAGVPSIKRLLEQNINGRARNEKIGQVTARRGNPASLESYQAALMFDGEDNKGRRRPRKDDPDDEPIDEGFSNGVDFTARMNAFNRRRGVKVSDNDDQAEEMETQQTRKSNVRGRENMRNTRVNTQNNRENAQGNRRKDNIGQDDDTDVGSESMDEELIAAYRNGIGL